MVRYRLVLALLAMFLLTHGSLTAQKYKWKHYYMEAGLLGGGSFSLGDYNERLFRNMQPTVGAFAKYKFNGHWELGLKSTVGRADIGSWKGEKHHTTFADLALIGEFNFFNYGTMSLEPYASRVSPYIFLGLGGSYFNSRVAPILPFGLGVKWNVTNRLNIGASWSMQKTLWSDSFDGIDNPLGQRQGIWDNQDWYFTLSIYISINFWEICPSCRDGRKNYFYNNY